MSSPTATQALLRPDLRDQFAEEWNATAEAATFIADQVAIRVDVPFAAATVKRIAREAMTKDPNTTNRAPDGTYEEVEFGDETFTYFTQEKGLVAPIDENLAAQTGIYYDAEVAATNVVMSKLMRMHERDVAAAAFSSSTFAGAALTTGVGTAWSTPSTATPIDNVNLARAKVRQNSGKNANALVLSWSAFEALANTTQILNRINGGATTSTPALATANLIAQLFKLDRIIVAGGLRDTADQAKTYVGADIWDATKALVAYIDPAATLNKVNLMNAYNWEGDGGSWTWTVERYWNEDKRRYMVRARRQVGIKVEYPECGHLLTGITA